MPINGVLQEIGGISFQQVSLGNTGTLSNDPQKIHFLVLDEP